MINFLNTLSLYILPLIIAGILIYELVKKAPAYESFVEGAKDGFNIAVRIIPYLIAIMVATAMFRSSGAIDILQNILKPVLDYFRIPTETLILMITRSLSGSFYLWDNRKHSALLLWLQPCQDLRLNDHLLLSLW